MKLSVAQLGARCYVACCLAQTKSHESRSEVRSAEWRGGPGAKYKGKRKLYQALDEVRFQLIVLREIHVNVRGGRS